MQRVMTLFLYFHFRFLSLEILSSLFLPSAGNQRTKLKMSATLGSTPSASTSKKHQKRSNSSVTGSTGSTTGSTKRRMKEYRIVIFGSRSVGKSSLVSVFLTGNFKESPEEETTESTFSKVLAVEGKFYLLDIVDTAGKVRMGGWYLLRHHDYPKDNPFS